MKKHFYILILFFSSLSLTSFGVNRKLHLIVGNWELLENQKNQCLFSKEGNDFSIERIYFSSDEIESGFVLRQKGKKKDETIPFGFKIYEPFDDFKNPVILFKNLCDDQTRIVFSILELNKGFLKLKFEKEFSSKNVDLKDEILVFERTAGPTENMPDSEDSIKIEINIDKE